VSARARETVVVIEHGAERAALRGRVTVAQVKDDVVAALEEGRCSTRRPAFLGAGNDARGGRHFVWNKARTRAYIIDGPRDGTVRVVITALVPWDRDDFVAEQGDSALRQAFERARRVA
jgi:hypothetical protein